MNKKFLMSLLAFPLIVGACEVAQIDQSTELTSRQQKIGGAIRQAAASGDLKALKAHIKVAHDEQLDISSIVNAEGFGGRSYGIWHGKSNRANENDDSDRYDYYDIQNTWELQSWGDHSRSPLYWAISSGNPAVVQCLLDVGATGLNNRLFYSIIAEQRNIQIIQKMACRTGVAYLDESLKVLNNMRTGRVIDPNTYNEILSVIEKEREQSAKQLGATGKVLAKRN